MLNWCVRSSEASPVNRRGLRLSSEALMKSWSADATVPAPVADPEFWNRESVYANWKFAYFMPENGWLTFCVTLISKALYTERPPDSAIDTGPTLGLIPPNAHGAPIPVSAGLQLLTPRSPGESSP